LLCCCVLLAHSAAGVGTVLAVVLQDGSLALVDTAQPAAKRPSFKARQALLRQVCAKPSLASPAFESSADSSSSSSSSIPLALLGSRPLGTLVMLPQPWVLLLRFLLQVGVWQWSLSCCCLSDPA
jgi:hypothetical protein